jgi:hypothetical protein
VFLESLNQWKSMFEYLSLCFLRNVVLNFTVPGKNQQKQCQGILILWCEWRQMSQEKEVIVINFNLNSPSVCWKLHSPNFKEFNFLLLFLYFLGTQPYFEDVFLAFSLQGSTNMIPQFGDISVNYSSLYFFVNLWVCYTCLS